jgi:hypothetical protein
MSGELVEAIICITQKGKPYGVAVKLNGKQGLF